MTQKRQSQLGKRQQLGSKEISKKQQTTLSLSLSCKEKSTRTRTIQRRRLIVEQKPIQPMESVDLFIFHHCPETKETKWRDHIHPGI